MSQKSYDEAINYFVWAQPVAAQPGESRRCVCITCFGKQGCGVFGTAAGGKVPTRNEFTAHEESKHHKANFPATMTTTEGAIAKVKQFLARTVEL